MSQLAHTVRGVDHVAFPPSTRRVPSRSTAMSSASRSCTRSALPGGARKSTRTSSISFSDIGNNDRLAFFYYFGYEPPQRGVKGDVYARFDEVIPDFFVKSRHLAIHVDGEADLTEYRRRLDHSQWPVELQVQHETIESIYTHDPNGYFVEITRALRAGHSAGGSRREPHRRRTRGRS